MSWFHRSHRLGNHSCWWHAASDVCTHLLRFREVPEQVSHKIFDFLGPSSMGVEPTAKHASVLQPQNAQQKQSLQTDSKWISWYPNLAQDSDPACACVCVSQKMALDLRIEKTIISHTDTHTSTHARTLRWLLYCPIAMKQLKQINK
jgi:hypothetical protein